MLEQSIFSVVSGIASGLQQPAAFHSWNPLAHVFISSSLPFQPPSSLISMVCASCDHRHTSVSAPTPSFPLAGVTWMHGLSECFFSKIWTLKRHGLLNANIYSGKQHLLLVHVKSRYPSLLQTQFLRVRWEPQEVPQHPSELGLSAGLWEGPGGREAAQIQSHRCSQWQLLRLGLWHTPAQSGSWGPAMGHLKPPVPSWWDRAVCSGCGIRRHWAFWTHRQGWDTPKHSQRGESWWAEEPSSYLAPVSEGLRKAEGPWPDNIQTQPFARKAASDREEYFPKAYGSNKKVTKSVSYLECSSFLFCFFLVSVSPIPYSSHNIQWSAWWWGSHLTQSQRSPISS